MISEGGAGDATPGEGANVTGVAEISSDGTRVYFDSEAVLTTKPNKNGEKAEPSVPNLYVYDTETRHLAFVARYAVTVDTTADGEYLVFENAHEVKGTNDKSVAGQLFEYDAATETVVRVSSGQKSPSGYECEATHTVEEGYNCDGNTSGYNAFAPRRNQDQSLLALPAAGTTGLAVSKEGAVVFVSGDPLTQGAVADGENIYEYEAGNVYLISPGSETVSTSPSAEEGSRLLGISENGQSVLFATTEQLVPQDTDTQSSWYDARENGGFPAPASTPECAGEACQGPLPASPTSASPLAAPGANENFVPTPLAPSKAKPKKITKKKPSPACKSKKASRTAEKSSRTCKPKARKATTNRRQSR
jgi:hypothetical protein